MFTLTREWWDLMDRDSLTDWAMGFIVVPLDVVVSVTMLPGIVLGFAARTVYRLLTR